jgi:hypothetical protein
MVSANVAPWLIGAVGAAIAGILALTLTHLTDDLSDHNP